MNDDHPDLRTASEQDFDSGAGPTGSPEDGRVSADDTRTIGVDLSSVAHYGTSFELRSDLESVSDSRAEMIEDDLSAPQHYRFLEFVGAGGMGVVMRAVDTRLEREIALKILKLTYDSNSIACRRFEFESKLTSQLQHPGIPAVHEVGRLEDGRPFMAMKLIKGKNLKQLLDEDNKNAGEWLSIFEAVCQAVAYAHAHNVVHRDLKPHNVMVGAFGEVQVMDWGLGKILLPADQQDDQETPARQGDDATHIRGSGDSGTDYTQDGSVLGTPAYMAPEQAIGAINRLDKRTDVFGLGGIMCHLLTGDAPFSAESAESSRQLAAQGDLTRAFDRLDACQATTEWVDLAKRCLSAKQDDRPCDAGEVAAAVARLRQEADERARKAELEEASTKIELAEQKKRKRVAILGGVVASSILVAGIIGTLIGLRQANEQRALAEQSAEDALNSEQEALASEQEAVDRQAETDEVLQFVDQRVFGAANPIGVGDGLGHDVTLRDAVISSIDKIPEAFGDRPMIEARVNIMIAQTLTYLSEHEVAAPLFERIAEIYEDEFGDTDPKTMIAINALADNYAHIGRWDECQRILEKILDIRRRQLGPDHDDTLNTWLSLGEIHMYRGNYRGGENCFRQALEGFEATHEADSIEVLSAVNSLGWALDFVGPATEAKQLHERALDICAAMFGPEHPNSLKLTNSVSTSDYRLGNYEQAATRTERNIEQQSDVLGPTHDHTEWGVHLLGMIYAKQGRHLEAVAIVEPMVQSRIDALGEDHPATLESKQVLGIIYQGLGRYEQAAELCEQILQLSEERLIDGHSSTEIARSEYGRCLWRLGRYSEALELLKESAETLEQANGPQFPETVTAKRDYANVLAEVGRVEEAISIHRENLSIQINALGEVHPETIICKAGLADALTRQSSFPEARSLWQSVFDNRSRLGDSNPETMFWMGRYSETLVLSGEPDHGLELARRFWSDALALEESPPMVFASLMQAIMRAHLAKEDLASLRAAGDEWSELCEARQFSDAVTLHTTGLFCLLIAEALHEVSAGDMAADDMAHDEEIEEYRRQHEFWIEQAKDAGFDLPE